MEVNEERSEKFSKLLDSEILEESLSGFENDMANILTFQEYFGFWIHSFP